MIFPYFFVLSRGFIQINFRIFIVEALANGDFERASENTRPVLSNTKKKIFSTTKKKTKTFRKTIEIARKLNKIKKLIVPELVILQGNIKIRLPSICWKQILALRSLESYLRYLHFTIGIKRPNY